MSDKNTNVAIITGGTTGLGAATACLFADKGYRVLVTGLSDPNDLVAKIRISGGTAVFLAADLRAPKVAADSIVAYAIQLWGRIDVLVNCAATINYQPVEEVTEKDWDEIFAINLKAAFFLSQQAFPYLAITKGNIINISSLNSWRPAKRNQLYDSLKAGLNNLTFGLALEFRDAGVRVNAILPGGFRTPLVNQWLEKYLDQTPTEADYVNPAISTPEAIAPVIIALASDEFNWVNGIELPVDGGFRLG